MIDPRQAHGRGVLAGIADYIDHHAHWQNFLEPEPDARILQESDVDGILSETDHKGMYAALLATRVPTITVAGMPIEHGPPAVIVDNRAVGRMAVDHLADLGLRDIGFVSCPNTHYSRQREDGVVQRIRHRKLKLWRCPEEAATKNEQALIAWLRSLPNPVGIVAANDRKALAVSRACRLAELHIPEQVALLGVDNEDETCRLADPPLTSIDHGTRRIGYEAAAMLDQWMTTGRRPQKSVLVQPIGVVARPSTDLLATRDPDVGAALRFIRARANVALKVSDVLNHVAVSRRSLELHFQEEIGRTIHEEILRVRIERAKHLLITSDQNILQIGTACGFSYASQFSRAFTRETGKTPLAFRHEFRYR